MSQFCAIEGCKRYSRASCFCCKLNLCREHINEHDDLLYNRLNPLADDVNLLNERLKLLRIERIINSAQECLEVWKYEEYRKIDQLAAEKLNEFRELVEEELQQRSKRLANVSNEIRLMMQTQATTVEELDKLSEQIRRLQVEVTQLEQKYNDLQFETVVYQTTDGKIPEKEFDLNTLTNPVQVIQRSMESSKAVAANDRILLVYQDSQLCVLNHDLTLVNQIRWHHNWVWDMCWSSTMARFFIVTLNSIFIFNDQDMSIKTFPVSEKLTFCACTCSKLSLYVATNNLASSVLEFDLSSNLALKTRWQSSDLCLNHEKIQDIVYRQGNVALIIQNERDHTKRMELRTANGFRRLWTLPFDSIDPLHNAFRLCPFNQNEWLMTDWRKSEIVHITKDGQIKSTSIYDPVPFRLCQFGTNGLAVSTKTSIDFYCF